MDLSIHLSCTAVASCSAHCKPGRISGGKQFTSGKGSRQLAPSSAPFHFIIDPEGVRQRSAITSKPLNVRPRMRIDQSDASNPKSRIAVVLR
jgi:hypothetical protein